MRDLLRGTLGRSLEMLPALDRLASAWPVACGTALAGRGAIAAYADGVIEVEVVSAEWMQPLLHVRSVLVSDLARIASVPVRAIHFRVAGAAPAPLPRNAPQPRSTQQIKTRVRKASIAQDRRTS